MYVSGGVAVIVVVLAILMMLSVIPMTPPFVGGMFLGLCLGLVGPLFIKGV
jgi:hypothetical protein